MPVPRERRDRSSTVIRLAAGIVLLASALLDACSRSVPSAVASRVASEDERFEHAMLDAAQADADEIVEDLVPIAVDNTALHLRTRDGHTEVLVATWAPGRFYQESIGSTKVLDHGVVWVTAVPELREFCASTALHGDPLARRVREYLGLRPESRHPDVVELWVDMAHLFRPCPDPEADDTRCTLGTPRDVAFGEVSFRAWFEEYASSAYGDGGYPWTRLGYTYDWGATDGERGASEFVIPKGTTVFVESVQSTDGYCDPGGGSSSEASGQPH